MITSAGIYIEDLSNKQSGLLLSLCEEFQPHSPFDEVAFLEMVTAARSFCDGSASIDDKITRIKNKYYFNGLRSSKKRLTSEQYYMVRKYVPMVKLASYSLFKYKPAEKELFMKIVRICRDFMRAKMSKDAEQQMLERLKIVRSAMVN